VNIFEINEKYQISLGKLKRLVRDGLLVCDEGDGHPLAPAMRANLMRNQDLSVEQLLLLIENPKIFAELKNRQSQARKQIAALGDYAQEAMPLALVSSVLKAAAGDAKGQAVMVAWVKSVLPGFPVPYAYLGVRAAIGILPIGRHDFLGKFAQALMNVRKDSEFAGWFRTDQIGSRKKTFYYNPGLDL
jgi:hypothetical protein